MSWYHANVISDVSNTIHVTCLTEFILQQGAHRLFDF